MRRKEERSKQGQTNNKAKQHSTPKAVTFPKKNEHINISPLGLFTSANFSPISLPLPRNLASGAMSLPSRERKWTNMKGLLYNLTTNQKYVRNYVFGQATKKVMKLTNGLYPAPLKIMKVRETEVHFFMSEIIDTNISLYATCIHAMESTRYHHHTHMGGWLMNYSLS